MNLSTLAQTEPISSLPRDYARLLAKTKAKKEPIVFLRRNTPVGALVSWEWLKNILEIKARHEEKEALANIAKSEKEFETGKAKVLHSFNKLR